MLDRTRRIRGRAVVATFVVLATVVLAACGNDADKDQNSLDPKGRSAQEIQNLFAPFFWVAVAIGVFVIAGTFYVAIRFRQKRGDAGNPKQVHGNSALEIGWTIVPALILAVMAVPTVATIWSLADEPTGDVVNIDVTAKQWWWEYEYRDQGQQLVTANEMHIPVGKWVKLSLKGPENGVIHSFWVPNLAGKKDVVPGRDHFLKLKAEEPGTYYGQCAEYCGLSHANMRLKVVAQPQEEYDAWVRAQRAELPAGTAQFIEKTLTANADAPWGCTGCHSFEPDKVGTGPNLTHLADRTGFAGDMYEMNFENLWKWVYDAPGRKPAGKLTGWMPSFKAQGMTEDQAKEIARFLLCETATDPSTHAAECQ